VCQLMPYLFQNIVRLIFRVDILLTPWPICKSNHMYFTLVLEPSRFQTTPRDLLPKLNSTVPHVKTCVTNIWLRFVPKVTYLFL